MSSLMADCRDVIGACEDLGVMFLLTARHMRTLTGAALLEATRKLAKRASDAESKVRTLQMRDAEFDSQRSVIERLTDENEALRVEVDRLVALGKGACI